MEKPAKKQKRDSQQIPVSLGKPSLRLRLEAYYSLIEPSRLEDQSQWRQNFESIFKKYGGTYEGERKLAIKLVKKYGTNVRLLLAKPDESQETSKPSKKVPIAAQEFDESWYGVSDSGTGDIDFCSLRFDPLAVLYSTTEEVARANPWFNEMQISILDNTLKFSRFLPLEDPLHQGKISTKHPSKSDDSSRPFKPQRQLHPFDTISNSFETGPFSVLRKLQRQRIRVLTRYVNAIRGCMTGTLVAFDKHMNLILRDVEEVYSLRPTERNSSSNVETELERRRTAADERRKGSSRRRRMKQIMLRGDNVVSVYRAVEDGKFTTTSVDLEK